MINQLTIYLKNQQKVRKIETGQGHDYTTRSFLDFQHFEDNHQLITVDPSRQKYLYADSTTIQQIEFYGKLQKNQMKSTQNFRKEKRNSFQEGTARNSYKETAKFL